MLGTVALERPARRERPSWRVGLSVLAGRPSRDVWALVAVVAAVLLANLPALLGLIDVNPLGVDSGLARSVTPGLLAGHATLDPNIGYSSQAIGHLAALDLLHLRLPWWNPYETTGMPLLGETQSAALFPPTLLTALANGQLLERMLLELVAGVCTYLLLRRLSITRWAAAAGGIAFALNGTFAWFAHAAINPVAFLPMLLLGIERAFAATCEGRPGGWRLLALAGALSIYAGFPEVAYIDALMGLAWLGWRCGCLPRAQLRTLLTKGALGALTAALLAAPMLIAMLDTLGSAYLAGHGTGSQLGSQHLGGQALPQLVMPYIYGALASIPLPNVWPMVGGYLTVSLLLFAVLGAFARGRRGLRLVLLGFGLLVFARMYGAPPLLGHVIGVLPAMGKLMFFRYATPTLELTVIVLAALGLDDLARVPEHRRRLLWAALAAVVLIAAAALGAAPVARTLGRRFPDRGFVTASIVWALLVVALAAAAVLMRAPRTRGALFASIVAVDALLMFAVPDLSAPRAVRVDTAPVAYLRRHLGTGRYFTLRPIGPNYGSYFGLASVNFNDFPPAEWEWFLRTRLDPMVHGSWYVGGWRPPAAPLPKVEFARHLAGWRSVGVRYLLTEPGNPPPRSPGLTVGFRSPTTVIYRLAGAASYMTASGCQVTAPARQSAVVSCSHPATLIRRESWFRGWSADVDGRPVPIERVDGLFQAVHLPAGTHRVTFSFAPSHMGMGLLGLLAGCGLLCSPRLVRHLRRPS